eukprot:9478176-Pyramimonas_sp.AAC.1
MALRGAVGRKESHMARTSATPAAAHGAAVAGVPEETLRSLRHLTLTMAGGKWWSDVAFGCPKRPDA